MFRRMWRFAVLGAMIPFALQACGDQGARVIEGGDVDMSLRVKEVAIGRAIGLDQRVADEGNQFSKHDAVYLSVELEGREPSAEVSARWRRGDSVLQESSRTSQVVGATPMRFELADPKGLQPGSYAVDVMLNGRRVNTKEFTVR